MEGCESLRVKSGFCGRSCGSEDGDLTHRSKARGGIVKVRGVEAIVRRRRVLRREGRWPTVWTPVGVPASSLRLLDVGKIGLPGAPPAIGEQAEDHRKQDEDWGEVSRAVADGGDSGQKG